MKPSKSEDFALATATIALVSAWAMVVFIPPGEAISIVPPPSASKPADDQWRKQAGPGDALKSIGGQKVAYWGRPIGSPAPDVPGAKVNYSKTATRGKEPIRALVIHYTKSPDANALVRYQHNGDTTRGAGRQHYGYHLYLSRSGKVLQGAPLTVRTNHVKPSRNKHRRKRGRWVDSSNSYGVSLVGACGFAKKLSDRAMTKQRCTEWKPTEAQERVARAVVQGLMRKYNVSKCAVFGHGDLQTDRNQTEGVSLAAEIRGNGC